MPNEYFDKAIHSDQSGSFQKGDIPATATAYPAHLLNEPAPVVPIPLTPSAPQPAPQVSPPSESE